MNDDHKGCILANSANIADLLFIADHIRTDLLEEMIELEKDKIYMQQATFPLWGKSQEAKFEFDKNLNLYQLLKGLIPVIKQLKECNEKYRIEDARLIDDVKADIKSTKDCMKRMAIYSSGDYKKIMELHEQEEAEAAELEKKESFNKIGVPDMVI